MKDIQHFLSTTAGKIIAIVLVLGIGLLIGSRGATHKNEPVAETPTETQVAVADSTPTAPVVSPVTAQKSAPAPKKTEAAPTPAPVTPPTPKPTPVTPTPAPSNETNRIDGLTTFRVSGGLQENWDADGDNDGPYLEVVYLDKNGNIITSDATETMQITADVKLYAGSNALVKPTKLVYSGHFDSSQIIFGSIYPKIRVPEEQISVSRSSDSKYGAAVVTIHTPEQGDFTATGNFVVLYE